MGKSAAFVRSAGSRWERGGGWGENEELQGILEVGDVVSVDEVGEGNFAE